MSDIKKFLEAIDSMSSAENNPRGPKFPGYWKGKDPASKSKSRMVGGATESILKDLSKGKSKDRNVEQELREAWKSFREEITSPAQPGQQNTTNQPNQNPNQPIDQKAANALKQNLSKLKTSVPGLDVTKASTSMAKADTGVQLNPMDQKVVSSMAPQIANIIKNPQMAGQLKLMIDKANKVDAAQNKV